MCPEPNGEAEFCIRCQRGAPPVDADLSARWDAALSASGVYLGAVCPTCVNECIALDGDEA
jgi:hypothetical protein